MQDPKQHSKVLRTHLKIIIIRCIKKLVFFPLEKPIPLKTKEFQILFPLKSKENPTF